MIASSADPRTVDICFTRNMRQVRQRKANTSSVRPRPSAPRRPATVHGVASGSGNISRRKSTLLVMFYLSLTSLSVKGLRGRRFIMSDSASSYAREMAGTYTKTSYVRAGRGPPAPHGSPRRAAQAWCIIITCEQHRTHHQDRCNLMSLPTRALNHLQFPF